MAKRLFYSLFSSLLLLPATPASAGLSEVIELVTAIRKLQWEGKFKLHPEDPLSEALHSVSRLTTGPSLDLDAQVEALRRELFAVDRAHRTFRLMLPQLLRAKAPKKFSYYDARPDLTEKASALMQELDGVIEHELRELEKRVMEHELSRRRVDPPSTRPSQRAAGVEAVGQKPSLAFDEVGSKIEVARVTALTPHAEPIRELRWSTLEPGGTLRELALSSISPTHTISVKNYIARDNKVGLMVPPGFAPVAIRTKGTNEGVSSILHDPKRHQYFLPISSEHAASEETIEIDIAPAPRSRSEGAAFYPTLENQGKWIAALKDSALAHFAEDALRLSEGNTKALELSVWVAFLGDRISYSRNPRFRLSGTPYQNPFDKYATALNHTGGELMLACEEATDLVLDSVRILTDGTSADAWRDLVLRVDDQGVAKWNKLHARGGVSIGDGQPRYLDALAPRPKPLIANSDKKELNYTIAAREWLRNVVEQEPVRGLADYASSVRTFSYEPRKIESRELRALEAKVRHKRAQASASLAHTYGIDTDPEKTLRELLRSTVEEEVEYKLPDYLVQHLAETKAQPVREVDDQTDEIVVSEPRRQAGHWRLLFEEETWGLPSQAAMVKKKKSERIAQTQLKRETTEALVAKRIELYLTLQRQRIAKAAIDLLGGYPDANAHALEHLGKKWNPKSANFRDVAFLSSVHWDLQRAGLEHAGSSKYWSYCVLSDAISEWSNIPIAFKSYLSNRSQTSLDHLLYVSRETSIQLARVAETKKYQMSDIVAMVLQQDPMHFETIEKAALARGGHTWEPPKVTSSQLPLQTFDASDCSLRLKYLMFKSRYDETSAEFFE